MAASETALIVAGPWPRLSVGGVAFPTYYLVISAVLSVSLFYIYLRAQQKNYSQSTALDLFMIVSAGAVLGARLFHVLFESPSYYLSQPLAVFSFWQGGFVFYGGLIGGIIAGTWVLRQQQQAVAPWLDFFAPVLSLAYALGRFACFFNGCCYGKACDLPWGYGFRQYDYHTSLSLIVYRHPTQLYFVITEFCLFLSLLVLEKKPWTKERAGRLFAVWLAVHSCLRFVIEIFRDDDRGLSFGPLSISMLLSVVFLCSTLYFLFAKKIEK